MKVIGYTQNGWIEVEFDGQGSFIPNDMGNRHRRMVAEWEVKGNIIPPYVEPVPTSEQITKEKISALQSSGKDLAFITIELIDYLLANTAMNANDFTPNVKQAYQKTKTIVDDVK